MASTLFILFAILVALAMPIAFSLGISSLAAVYFNTTLPLTLIPQRMFTSTDSFSLMAIPFFMIAGALMETGGISKRLIKFADAFVGHFTAGLPMVGIFTCMIFAAISGSGPATVAAIGGIMIPAMIKDGYPAPFAAAIMAIAGSIGIIIPPSIPFVTYGVSSNSSIGDLFMGGMVPGVVLGTTLMFAAYRISKKNGYGSKRPKQDWSARWIATKEAFWALLMPIIILGGIYGGFFTPTEAAAIAVVYGFFVGVFVYKEMKLEQLSLTFTKSGINSSMVMLIIATSSVFSWILTSERIPDAIANAVLSLTDSSIMILLLINILLLIVGCIMETNAAIIILAPIFLPIVEQFGVDPVHFGVIMVMNLAVGMVTPPLGVNLFVACGITDIKIEQIAKQVIPLIGVNIIVLLLITYVPQIPMFLPNLIKSLG